MLESLNSWLLMYNLSTVFEISHNCTGSVLWGSSHSMHTGECDTLENVENVNMPSFTGHVKLVWLPNDSLTPHSPSLPSVSGIPVKIILSLIERHCTSRSNSFNFLFSVSMVSTLASMLCHAMNSKLSLRLFISCIIEFSISSLSSFLLIDCYVIILQWRLQVCQRGEAHFRPTSYKSKYIFIYLKYKYIIYFLFKIAANQTVFRRPSNHHA